MMQPGPGPGPTSKHGHVNHGHTSHTHTHTRTHTHPHPHSLTQTWHDGDECEALWQDGHFYKAVIEYETPNGYYITYQDFHDSIEVPASSLKKRHGVSFHPTPSIARDDAYESYSSVVDRSSHRLSQRSTTTTTSDGDIDIDEESRTGDHSPTSSSSYHPSISYNSLSPRSSQKWGSLSKSIASTSTSTNTASSEVRKPMPPPLPLGSIKPDTSIKDNTNTNTNNNTKAPPKVPEWSPRNGNDHTSTANHEKPIPPPFHMPRHVSDSESDKDKRQPPPLPVNRAASTPTPTPIKRPEDSTNHTPISLSQPSSSPASTTSSPGGTTRPLGPPKPLSSLAYAAFHKTPPPVMTRSPPQPPSRQPTNPSTAGSPGGSNPTSGTSTPTTNSGHTSPRVSHEPDGDSPPTTSSNNKSALVKFHGVTRRPAGLVPSASSSAPSSTNQTPHISPPQSGVASPTSISRHITDHHPSDEMTSRELTHDTTASPSLLSLDGTPISPQTIPHMTPSTPSPSIKPPRERVTSSPGPPPIPNHSSNKLSPMDTTPPAPPHVPPRPPKPRTSFSASSNKPISPPITPSPSPPPISSSSSEPSSDDMYVKAPVISITAPPPTYISSSMAYPSVAARLHRANSAKHSTPPSPIKAPRPSNVDELLTTPHLTIGIPSSSTPSISSQHSPGVVSPISMLSQSTIHPSPSSSINPLSPSSSGLASREGSPALPLLPPVTHIHISPHLSPHEQIIARLAASPYQHHAPHNASDYQLLEVIGRGAYGVVYRAHCAILGMDVAIKILDLDRAFQGEQDLDVDESYNKFEETWREITVTRLLAHPNLVRYMAAFVREQQLWIVLPLMAGGSCKDALEDSQYQRGLKDNILIATILRELLKALDYLHRQGYVHKDVKAENILLSEQGEVGLADFGVTAQVDVEPDETVIDMSESTATRQRRDRIEKRRKRAAIYAGTPVYMAPEIIGHSAFKSMYEEQEKHRLSHSTLESISSPPSRAHRSSRSHLAIEDDLPSPQHTPDVTSAIATSPTSEGEQAKKKENPWATVGHKADMWSLGITALELAYGVPPHVDADPVAIRKMVLNDAPPSHTYYRDASYSFSKDFHALVAACLVKNPSERPSASSLLSHKFLKSYAKPAKYVKDKLVTELIKRRNHKAQQEARDRKEQQRKERVQQSRNKQLQS